MISVLLIGEMGDEVMIVDKNEDIVNKLAPRYTNALIADCMSLDNLETMDIPSFDACVVAIGEDFQASLEITSNLKDCGARRIVSRATTAIQRKFLMRVGADEVIYPDMDIAEKLAVRLNSDNVINFVDLDADYAIFEIELPKKWLKKTLVEVNPRVNYGSRSRTAARSSIRSAATMCSARAISSLCSATPSAFSRSPTNRNNIATTAKGAGAAPPRPRLFMKKNF